MLYTRVITMRLKKLLFIIICYFFILLIICCDMSPAPVLEEHINKYSRNINEIEDNIDKKDSTELVISIFFPSSKNNTWILLRLNQSIFLPNLFFPQKYHHSKYYLYDTKLWYIPINIQTFYLIERNTELLEKEKKKQEKIIVNNPVVYYVQANEEPEVLEQSCTISLDSTDKSNLSYIMYSLNYHHYEEPIDTTIRTTITVKASSNNNYLSSSISFNIKPLH